MKLLKTWVSALFSLPKNNIRGIQGPRAVCLGVLLSGCTVSFPEFGLLSVLHRTFVCFREVLNGRVCVRVCVCVCMVLFCCCQHTLKVVSRQIVCDSLL